MISNPAVSDRMPVPPVELSKKKLQIAVFIDHDIMVRHFLKSGVFEELVRSHAVTFVFPPEGHRRLKSDITEFCKNAAIRRLDVPTDRRRLWARLTQVDAMRPSFDPHVHYLRRAWRRTMNWKAATLHTVLGIPGIRAAFQRWSLARLARSPYVELEHLLDESDFDIVINPGVPIGLYTEDLTRDTRRRNIPFLLIMNSWDNPSGGTLPAGIPDFYAVWGEQTARHAMKYLGMPRDRVIKLGAAQFEQYRDPPRIDRQTFCRLHDVDPESQVILYAGGSLGTNEFEHLQLLEAMIDRGVLANVTIVYRPHPWGGGGNAGEEIIVHNWRHVRIENTMRDYLVALKEQGYHMTFPDYRDTHDVLSSVDCVVSPLSTIVIEAALHGKPVMCFLPLEDLDAEHFQNVYDMPHFSEMYVDPNILVARGRAELVDKMKPLLDRCGDPAFPDRLAETCRFFVEEFDEPYGVRLCRYVEYLVASSNRPSSVKDQHTGRGHR